MDWLVEVHTKLRLQQETLYLCVQIIDRYLGQEKVERTKLQLVGLTALFLACKYEEKWPPEVKDMVYMSNRAFSRQDLLDMEADITKTLQFKLSVPTGYYFLQRFLFISKASPVQAVAANYYMDRMLQEYDLIVHRPSLIAAAAVTLAVNHDEIRAFDQTREPKPGVVCITCTCGGVSHTFCHSKL